MTRGKTVTIENLANMRSSTLLPSHRHESFAQETKVWLEKLSVSPLTLRERLHTDDSHRKAKWDARTLLQLSKPGAAAAAAAAAAACYCAPFHLVPELMCSSAALTTTTKQSRAQKNSAWNCKTPSPSSKSSRRPTPNLCPRHQALRRGSRRLLLCSCFRSKSWACRVP